MKTFPDKQKLKTLSASVPVLKEMLWGIHNEMKDTRQ
jgi:hypothetical protein